MPRAPKKCATFSCEERVVARRYCPSCATRRISPSAKAAKDPVERRRRAEVVAAWVVANGWWCPGYGRPGHASRDLTAAHSTAVARGGVGSTLTVLCRSCNSSQGTKSST